MCPAQPDSAPSAEPPSLPPELGIPRALLERVQKLLVVSLSALGEPVSAPLLRHLSDCGALLAAGLRSDADAIGVSLPERAVQVAYLVGVAMAWVQLDRRKPADPRASATSSSYTDLCRHREALRELLGLPCETTPGARGATDGHAGPPVERFARDVSDCLFALRNELDGGDERLRMLSPVLQLARLYEDILVGSDIERFDRGRVRTLRRRRLLTPIRAWAYARQAPHRAAC